MIKAIIFDLDGTLADTLPAMLKALNFMLKRYGIEKIDAEKMRSFINGTVEDFVTSVLPMDMVRNNGGVQGAIECYEKFYAVTYKETSECISGINTVLEELSKNNLLAILSNKQQEYVDKLAEKLFRKGLFSRIVGMKSGIPGKPNPISMSRLLTDICVEPNESVYIGDSDVDILTAKNAGMEFIRVSWGYRSAEYLRQHGATIIVDDPNEILNEIRKMNAQ